MNATNFNTSINHWDVSHVVGMAGVFRGATSFNQPLNNWDTSSATNMGAIFDGATSFNQPLNNWDVSHLTSGSLLFRGATSFNQPLNNWDTSGWLYIGSTFLNATSFNQPLNRWNIRNVADANGVLSNTGMSTVNYDITLKGWDTQTLQSGVTMDATGITYCSAESQRANIISTYGWTINDAGKNCTTQQPFITTWKTDNTGDINDRTITIPTLFGGYNYDVDWGDGNTSIGQTGNASHTYAIPGTYTVSISGTFPHLYMQNYGGAEKLLTVEQWGTNSWRSMRSAFLGASNLTIQATDKPDLSNVTDMNYMFYYASSFNQPIEDWDVSGITSMNGLFTGATSFNQPLNTWDVSNVIDMHNLFVGASSFNQPIEDWDVSNAGDMGGMFFNALSFNQPLNTWNVSSVVNMAGMFTGSLFNQPLNTWNVSSVTHMQSMFFYTPFNQPINSWNVSNVTTMVNMFSYTPFNQPLNSWNVANVTNMSGMFDGATAFNRSLGSWHVDNVTNMVGMFGFGSGLSVTNYDATLTGWSNRPLRNNVTFDAGTSQYCNAEAQRQSIITSRSWTINDSGEAPGCVPTDPDDFITTWKTDVNSDEITIPTTGSLGDTYDYTIDWGDGTVETHRTGDASHTYSNAGTYSVQISGLFPRLYFADDYDNDKLMTVEQWGSNKWQSMAAAFIGASNLTINATDTPDLSETTSMAAMFADASSLNSDISDWDVSSITNMSDAFLNASSFNQPLNAWQVNNVTDMHRMFLDAAAFNQPLDSWNVSNVTTMSSMFSGASIFNQPVGGWAVGSVTDTSDMFRGARAFNQSLDNWSVISVEDASYMFAGASAFNQPLNGWETDNIADMNAMFAAALSFNQPLDSWNVSNVTTMSSMFAEATSFNQPLSTWNTDNVTSMLLMFSSATSFNQPLDSWNVANVTSMNYMFSSYVEVGIAFNEINLGIPYSSWSQVQKDAFYQVFTSDMPSLTESNYLTFKSGLSVPNYDATLIGWSGQSLQSTVTFDAGTSKYCAAEVQRQDIIDSFGWTINDSGKDCAVQRPFIMKVKTDNPGDSGNNEFEVTYGNDSDTYDFDVDCDNDGTPEFTHQTYSVVCSYPSAGEYEVAVSGAFPHMALNSGNGHDAEKILEVQQWGDIEWHSMEGMFWGASNVQVTATDSPNLQAVTNMSAMFYEATTFNANIGSWDTSNVTNMAMMFYGATAFNQSLNGWSTGNVTNMGEMFKEASSFNANISSWNTGNVTNMFGMFSDGSIFNQDISGWNTGNVTDMSELFFSNSHFNQPIGQWQTGSVTAMRRMFGSAANFNQDIGGWNVGNVTNMSEMFNMATTFNQPLGSWNTGSVTDMSSMFTFATVFSQPINSWNVGNVTNMAMMFNSAPQFNQPLSNWNIDQVTTMQSMFGSFVDYMEFYYGPVADWDQNFKTMVFDELSQIVGHTMNEQNYQTLDSGMSTANYDDTLIGWSARSLQDDVIFDAGYSRYCTAEVQRQSMIDTFSWTINDDGKNCQGYLPTDMSLATTLANSGTIKVGDTLNYTLTVRNHGPNNGYDNYDAAVLTLLPATMEFVSAAGAFPVNCTVVMAEDIGIPAFVQHYSGLQVVFCIWTPTPLLTPGDTTTLNIQTKLKSTVQNGNEVKLRSLLYWYNDIDRNTVEYALDNGEDVYGLTVNNVSNYAFTYTATPDVPDVPNPQTPTNPNPPGAPIRPRPTTPSPIVKGVCEALTVRTVGSDPYAVPLAVAYTVETTGDTTGTTYVYDFGDGTTQESSDKVVEHTYDKWGTYSAAVRLKTSNGLAEQNQLCSVRLGVGQVVAKESVSSFGGALASVRTRTLLTRTIALLPFVFTSLLLLIAMIYLWLAYRDKKQQDKLKELLERNRKTRQSISNFVAISSHYLNTPLATMQGALEILTAAKQKGTLTSITTYTLDGIRKQLQGLSNYVQGIVGQNESVLQADTKQVGSVSIVELAKTKRIWMPLAITGLMIAIIDIGLTLSGGYKLAELRLANAVAFFVLAGISIIVAGIMRSRSEALRAGIEQELASEKTLLSQKQALIHDIARQLESYQHLLIQESATVQQLPEGRLFFNGLKDFGKLTQSLISGARFATLSASPQSILATEIITSVVTSLDPAAKQKNVTIQSTVEPEVTMQLEGSEARFLLTAFLDNAIKFSPENAKVDLQARRHGKHDIFTIRDGGPGIDQAIVSQLSQPFTRGTDTITYNNQGLGLGLYNAKILIEKLGGSLELAASTHGAGTVATITLPHTNSLPTSMVYAPA